MMRGEDFTWQDDKRTSLNTMSTQQNFSELANAMLLEELYLFIIGTIKNVKGTQRNSAVHNFKILACEKRGMACISEQ
jgi:hypothetical protein